MPIDNDRTGSLLLRKCLRELPSGEDVIGFKGMNGHPVDLEGTIQTIINDCGDVLIALYGGEAPEAPPPAPAPPAPAPPKATPTKLASPKPPSAVGGGYMAPAASAVLSRGGEFSQCATLQAGEQRVSSLSFASHEPALLASSSSDQSISLWDVAQKGGGSLRKKLPTAHAEAVTCVSFGEAGPLASTSGDQTCKVWTPDGSVAATLAGHGDWVKAVAWSSQGLIATASDDRTVIVWNSATGLVFDAAD